MPNVHDTVKAYFDALVARDAETFIAMMLPAAHYVKIGTDIGEIVEGVCKVFDMNMIEWRTCEVFIKIVSVLKLPIYQRGYQCLVYH